MKPFFVYLLRCSDGSFYVGHTDELELRVAQHQTGDVEGYTQTRRPVVMVWCQETASRLEALSAERQIKGWGRAKKEALIAGDWDAVKRHAWGTRNPLPMHLRDDDAASFDTSGRSEIPPQPERGVVGVPERGAVESEHKPQPVRPEVSKDPLITPLLNNNRRALAKSITLLESTRPDHRARADALLNAVLPHTGKAMRLGISGVPGVGKSTFIETLGLALIKQGHRVAVLAIDPSSSVSGGSILGDKTRMEMLSVNEAAYIRPSPASGTLGGVAEKTREAMLVCEAAGYDVVIVETVGVGQSEIAVASMTDMFVLLQLPNAGDDLQAIKKGVMELADLVVINKADIDSAAATRAEAQITGVLRIFTPHGHPDVEEKKWHTQVMQMSALKSQGLDAFLAHVKRFHEWRHASGELAARRQQQAMAWMWDLVHARLTAEFHDHPAVKQALPQMLSDVTQSRIAPSAAARLLLNLKTNT
jgi:LAO/AO transport system kinase